MDQGSVVSNMYLPRLMEVNKKGDFFTRSFKIYDCNAASGIYGVPADDSSAQEIVGSSLCRDPLRPWNGRYRSAIEMTLCARKDMRDNVSIQAWKSTRDKIPIGLAFRWKIAFNCGYRWTMASQTF